MAGRRSFKTDESFLEKLALGAIGARGVFGELQRQGHQPIELERGSMGYKIWKNIKIKRLRVPDILCLKCGARVEARAKSRLEITMSHSLSDSERCWDKGLTDRDVVALSLCTKTGDGAIDWQCGDLIQFVSVETLRKAFTASQVVTEKPKGAGEGFELRVTWPSVVAGSDGVVSSLSADRLQFKRETDQRTISVALSRKAIPLQPLVKVDELIPLLVDDDARRWVAYIVGTQGREQFAGQVEELRRHDPEVYFAVTVLWMILASWVYSLDEY